MIDLESLNKIISNFKLNKAGKIKRYNRWLRKGKITKEQHKKLISEL